VTSTGMFGDKPVTRKGRVLLLNDEDDPSRVIRPRLEAIGADIDRIRVIDDPFILNEEGVDTVLDRAVRALEDYLTAGPAKARDVMAAMKKKGVQDRTLDRAKKKLGVVSGKGPGAKWKLPD
ncbi:MAG: AAA family ATPase, partial [Alphaproteobacteria bacterium]|nr:AAA family ATPase [Alphaproteobacteria bacterium]